MFNCEYCHETSKPSDPMVTIPIKFREKLYENGVIGKETVKEIKVCNPCATKIQEILNG